ncbi:MAG: histidine kinase N-terminal 7TM domain-containing protein [Chloroflexota bacterium]
MMYWQYFLVIIPLIGAALISLSLTLIASRYRATLGSRPFSVLTIAITIWALGYALSLVNSSLATKLFWTNVIYIGIVFIPVAWVVLAMQYADHRQQLTRRTIVLLSIMPIITLLSVWTNSFHGLFRGNVSLIDSGALSFIETQMGPLFWAHTIYSYSLFLYGTVTILQTFIRATPQQRKQATTLLVGGCLPWLGNMVYLAGLSPIESVDITPFTFTLTAVVLAWGLFRYQLFDIIPIAREVVIENIRDGVIVLDSQKRVVDINPAAMDILDQPNRGMIGKPAEMLFARYHDRFDYLWSKQDARIELQVDHNAGPQVFDTRLTQLQGKRGEHTGYLIVVSDITERKQNEHILYKAKEMAEAANIAKSSFIGTMSHELRTPLTTIIGYCELLQRQADELEKAQLTEDLSAIWSAGHHLLALVNNLLDLSKIEAGQMALFLDEFDVHMLVDEIITTTRPLVESHGNSLIVQCPADLGIISSDPTKIRQILFNIVSNAAKFTDRGTVTFEVEREEINGTISVVFRITDTGIGIETEKIPYLFEAFTQADSSTTRRYGGTGLGLSLSRHLCQMLDGEISVVSSLGEGSTFTVRLPSIQACSLTSQPLLTVDHDSFYTPTPSLLQPYTPDPQQG